VQGVWAQAVGPALARHAEPVAEREGTLTVLCASGAWAQEVELLGPTLVEAVNRALGEERLKAVRTTATRGRRPRPRPLLFLLVCRHFTAAAPPGGTG
jgi:predicted nucleic acid-binding Zn ribbon protein